MAQGRKMKPVGTALPAALVIACLLVCAWNLIAAAVPSAPAYQILKRYTIPGSGALGAVRVDPAAHRIYVATAGRVEVLNADTGKKEGQIPIKDARDILLVPQFKRGFVTSGAGASITIFSTDSLRIIKVLPAKGTNADSLAYDPGLKRVFYTDAGSGDIGAVSADSGDLISSENLQQHVGSAVANGYGEVFATDEGRNTIDVLDSRALKFLGDFPLDAGCQPSSLALDPRGRRLFVACTDGWLQVIDTDIGFTFEKLPIGKGAGDADFTFLPQGADGWKGAVFVATNDGTLSFVRMDAFIHYSNGGALTLPPGIRSLAYDSSTHDLYVSNGSAIIVIGPSKPASKPQ